jgi:hypothetical protein
MAERAKNNGLLETILEGLRRFQYELTRPREVRKFLPPPYGEKPQFPLDRQIGLSQQLNIWEMVYQIRTGLQQQLHEKMYGSRFYGSPEELNSILRKAAPEEWGSIERDLKETWIPYIWQNMYGRPITRTQLALRPKFAGGSYWTGLSWPYTELVDIFSPVKPRVFPSRLSSLLAYLGKELPWHND